MVHSVRFRLFIALAASVFAAVTLAQPVAQLPSQIIVPADPNLFALTGSGRAKADANIVSVKGNSFPKAWHVAVREKVGADYNLQFVYRPKESLKTGDVILFTAYARMISTADDSGEGLVGFVLEQSKDPFAKVFAASFGVGKEWQRFDVLRGRGSRSERNGCAGHPPRRCLCADA